MVCIVDTKVSFSIRKPSEYIDITPQELLSLLKADGHDIATASYADADPYELIVYENGRWLSFNRVRGQC
jgi:hypothetical protein